MRGAQRKHHERAANACANGARRNAGQHPKPSLHALRAARRRVGRVAAGEQAEVAVLGGEDFIYSQQSGVREELFKGSVLGVDADVAQSAFRQTELQSLAHLPDGLEPPQRFLERVAVHFARNVLSGAGDIPGQVPLVLGIWGPKGAGKTFNLELCLKKMGVSPVCLSAGELEDEWAGEPGRRLRERYSFAARVASSTGHATCLVISDLDAGVGTFAHTRNTVNTQILQGTLMSLSDDPLSVSTGQEWAAVRGRVRVPIYVTANDLTCLYAPLVREGRMDKFYFEPDRLEMAGALQHLFDPHLSRPQVEAVLDAFPGQPMDFFGALKSRLADAAVRGWLNGSPQGAEAAMADLIRQQQQRRPGARRGGGGGPRVELRATLEAVLAAGHDLAREQQAVLDLQLSKQYMPGVDDSPEAVEARRQKWRRRRWGSRPSRQEAEAGASERAAAAAAARGRAAAAEGLGAYWDSLAQNSWVTSSEEEQLFSDSEERGPAAEEQRQHMDSSGGGNGAGNSFSSPKSATGAGVADAAVAAAVSPGGWPLVTPDDLAAALRSKSAVVLDVRTARDWEWGKIKGAAHCPFIESKGSSLNPTIERNPRFLDHAKSKAPDKGRRVIVYGPGRAQTAEEGAVFVSKELFVSLAPGAAGGEEWQDVAAEAAQALLAAGYASVAELAGGYRAWDLAYRPDGRKRERGNWADRSSGDLEWWTASN